MWKRFLRIIVGILYLFTSPITLIPLLIIWGVTNKNIIFGIINWIICGEYGKKEKRVHFKKHSDRDKEALKHRIFELHKSGKSLRVIGVVN